jgi:RNA polymerase sigma-70 factor (ECF subfamily)
MQIEVKYFVLRAALVGSLEGSEPRPLTDDRVSHLYRTYGPAIFARCRRILRDESAAEDATQETFVRVHRHLDEVPDDAGGKREALRWIYRVATNHCLHELRKGRVRPVSVEELPPALGPDPSERRLSADLVQRLVAHVPAKLSEPAWLHHVDGMEQGEVAELLGVSRGTVINRLREFHGRALRFLAESA